MVEGEKRRIWIPEALAYKGQPESPQGMLVFEVELLKIGDAPAPHGPMGGMGGPGGMGGWGYGRHGGHGGHGRSPPDPRPSPLRPVHLHASFCTSVRTIWPPEHPT